MSVSSGLRRLLRVRAMEEEQQRTALEAALAELHRIETVIRECAARERRGRALMRSAGRAEESSERQAGMVEAEVARRRLKVLSARLSAAEGEIARLRQAFLDKRIERRQAETLIDEAAARDAAESSHRAQQGLDDWHGRRRRSADEAAHASRQVGGKDEEIVRGSASTIPATGKQTHF